MPLFARPSFVVDNLFQVSVPHAADGSPTRVAMPATDLCWDFEDFTGIEIDSGSSLSSSPEINRPIIQAMRSSPPMASSHQSPVVDCAPRASPAVKALCPSPSTSQAFSLQNPSLHCAPHTPPPVNVDGSSTQMSTKPVKSKAVHQAIQIANVTRLFDEEAPETRIHGDKGEVDETLNEGGTEEDGENFCYRVGIPFVTHGLGYKPNLYEGDIAIHKEPPPIPEGLEVSHGSLFSLSTDSDNFQVWARVNRDGSQRWKRMHRGGTFSLRASTQKHVLSYRKGYLHWVTPDTYNRHLRLDEVAQRPSKPPSQAKPKPRRLQHRAATPEASDDKEDSDSEDE